jgi:phospholipid-binding lipoprotein MlaA
MDRRGFPLATGAPAARRSSVRLALGLLAAGTLATAALAQASSETSDTSLPIAGAEAVGASVNDPFQAFNRASYGFSMNLDRWVTGPIAHAYMAVAPDLVRDRISAAVDNLSEPRTLLNDVAQGHPKRAGVTSSRFLINSTVGVLGLFDVATDLGLPYHRGDFGQTLGRYGVQPGAFLYIPVLGPLTVREGAGRVVDSVTDPVTLVGGGSRTTFGATRAGVTLVNTRAHLDPQVRALEDATDPYAAVRSAYLQRRAALVREATGKVQALPDFDDAPSTSPEVPPSVPAPSAPGPQ